MAGRAFTRRCILMKKAVSLFLACALCFSLLVPVSAAGERGIQVLLDGKALTFDVAPVLSEGRTMVPFRPIFEALGYKVAWDQLAQRITASNDARTITLTLGSTAMTVNGKTAVADAAPFLKDGRTMVPVRAVSEASDCDVLWDQAADTVLIYHRRTGLERGSLLSKAMTTDGSYLYAADSSRLSTVRIHPKTLEVTRLPIPTSNYYDYHNGKLYGFFSGYAYYDLSKGFIRSLTDGWVFSPSYAGDYIYFNGPTYAPADEGSDSFGLFRVPAEGGPWERVADKPVKFDFVFQSGHLFTDGGEIYSAADGSRVKKLTSGIEDPGYEDMILCTALYGDWYYVAFNGYRSERDELKPRGILAYNHKTEESRFLPCDKVIHGIEVTENSLFVMADEGKQQPPAYVLYRMTADGTHPVELWRNAETEGLTYFSSLTALGNYLYFRHGDGSAETNPDTLCRVPMAGGAEEVILTAGPLASANGSKTPEPR
ncbi:MAG: hypothetical protein EOM52_07320 [Clostridia bacterium]|nr:hypothetical protein [Clostridia bacterium]